MHEWVDHTSEVELSIAAADEQGVYADALRGLAELLADEDGGASASHAVEAVARDRPALLASWLEELLFLAETQGFVPERIAELRVDDDRLRSVVAGRTGSPSPIVKAVTYHRLAFEPDGDGWTARVIFDV